MSNKNIAFQGPNGRWYASCEDEDGSHHQGEERYETAAEAVAAADAEDDEAYERCQEEKAMRQEEYNEYAAKNPATAAYIAARKARSAARAVWLASDEERHWFVGGATHYFGETLFFIRPSEIKKHLKSACRSYHSRCRHEETLRESDWASPIDPVTGEPIHSECVKVTTIIEADEIDCDGPYHYCHLPYGNVYF